MTKRSPLSILIRALLTIAIWFAIFWFALPAINFASSEFRFWIVVSILIAAFLLFAPDMKTTLQYFEMKVKKYHYTGPVVETPHVFVGILGVCAGIIVLSLVISCVGAPVFNAGAYHGLIEVSDGDFTEDVAEIGMNSIPVVDRATAIRLGSRKLGEISDMISQFEIETDYTQINYKGVPTRVTPLVYADPIRWLYNMRDGIPAYITVNLVTQETDLVRLDNGIKYSRGDYFMRNIDRYLRFNYPTKIFDEISFEIDDNGVPYWVAPTINYEIMLWSGKNINGAVLVNAVTGESKYYPFDEIPSWVDQVCISDLVIQQLNYYGLYGSGFINSIFGQRGVLATTEGYNYLALDDDVYLYTGLTSVLSDESNIGFVLVNLRTKETKFYTVPGAEEYSAMSSAEGQVQNLKYKATFPILLNIAGRPTYFLSLKDNAELVKMYAFVDVEQYQIVATGVSVAEAQKNYVEKLKSADVDADIGSSAETNAQGTVSALSPVVISGTTGYYFKMEGDEAIYFASITVSDRLAFLSSGDQVEVNYTEVDGLREVTEIIWK